MRPAVKGSAEDALAALDFARASYYRPSLLVTRNVRYGLQDRLTQAIFPILAWLLPSRFHAIRVEDLARAMRVNAERSGGPATEALHHREFVALARG